VAVKTKKRARKKAPSPARLLLRKLLKWAAQGFWTLLGIQAVVIFLFAFVDPPTNFYQWSEGRRLEGIRQDWRPIEEVSADVARAVVAAEDANFCQHWGFDLGAIRAAVTSGSGRLRGASTLSQQVAKNVFLWPGRNWVRKALEAEITMMIELFWSKRRIIEVYLNVAEFDEGVFGVQAAGRHYFGVDAAQLSLVQAARLAAILPNPKNRSAKNPSPQSRRRAAGIADGAETIRLDGRAACFEVLK